MSDKILTSQPNVRYVAAAATVADIRNAELMGREHVVVPVIAAVGGIAISAMGSQGASELVPTESLALSVPAWNGRPVVFNHPVDENNNPVTANSPDVVSRYCIGYLYNVRLEDSKLKGDAWIDPERVASVGDGAVAVLDRILSREMVEVSVGCRVNTVEASGRDSRGRDYTRAWTDIVPDHLAFLAVGVAGACSNDAGCGAPRAALRAASKLSMGASTMTMFQRILSKLRFGNEESGPSDNDLRYKISESLHASEPAFDGVVAIYSESSTVIYSVCPNGEYMLKRRAYTMGESGEVALADDVEIVESRVEFVPVKKDDEDKGESKQAVAASAPPSKESVGAACSCGDHRDAADNGSKGVNKMETNKEMVERLIACTGSPFAEEDRANLEAFPTARLAALVDGLTGSRDVAGDPPEPDPATPRTAEEWMREAPPEVQEMVSRYRTEEKARHASLVSALKGAQKAYDEAELVAMTVPQLVKVATLAGVVDPDAPPTFDGRSIPDLTRAASAERVAKRAPRPYDIALGRDKKPDQAAN